MRDDAHRDDPIGHGAVWRDVDAVLAEEARQDPIGGAADGPGQADQSPAIGLHASSWDYRDDTAR